MHDHLYCYQCLYISISILTYMYVYVYDYVYIYLYIYVYICLHMEREIYMDGLTPGVCKVGICFVYCTDTFLVTFLCAGGGGQGGALVWTPEIPWRIPGPKGDSRTPGLPRIPRIVSEAKEDSRNHCVTLLFRPYSNNEIQAFSFHFFFDIHTSASHSESTALCGLNSCHLEGCAG